MANPNVNLSEIDFNKNNIIFVDDLTLETVKIKYNWLLNASVKDAIVGQDDNGLVWYFGEWLCGEWYDGTWYSGIWHSGNWKNGQFYAYNMDKFQVLSNNFRLLNVDNTKSEFRNGFWENGTFNSGIFGVDNNEYWEGYELSTEFRPEVNGQYPIFQKQIGTDGGNITYDVKSVATWINGIFVSGEMNDCIWMNGTVRNTYAKNIQWVNGKWFNGTFEGYIWWTGLWYNGNFIKGTWKDGTFHKLNSDLDSRFGNATLPDSYNITGETICLWEDGVWKNGEFFSGINKDDNGNILPSIYNNASVWEKGTWENGYWYGGHFKDGLWKNGIWYNGIFGDLLYGEWLTPSEVYQVNSGDLEGDWTYTNGDIIQDRIVLDNDSGLTELRLLEYNDFGNFNNSGSSYTWDNDVIIDGVISWTFESILNNPGYTSFYSTEEFLQDYSIYIVSDIYTGYANVLSTDDDGTWYIINIDILLDSSVTGGIVYNADDWDSKLITKTLRFSGIDFDLEDTEIENISGYQVKVDKKISTTNSTSLGDIRENLVSIGFNIYRDGYWYELEKYDPTFFQDPTDIFDIIPYDPIPDVLEGKTSSKPINDINIKESVLGDIDDTWTLENTKYYGDKVKSLMTSITNSSITYQDNVIDILNKDPNDINVTSNDEDLLISLDFNYDKITEKSLEVSNIKVRVISTNTSIPTWNNGTWNKGTWINGVFENGQFLSGLWLNGDFNDGQMGGN